MLAEIAQSTYDYQEYPVVMATLWKKVGSKGSEWRVVYKALNLLEFLIRNGSERSVEDAERILTPLGRAQAASSDGAAVRASRAGAGANPGTGLSIVAAAVRPLLVARSPSC